MPPDRPPQRAGLSAYLKTAFLYHWNVGLLAVGVVASLLTWPDAMLPLVGALEVMYLGGVVGIPKFRGAIDAQRHAAGKPAPEKTTGPSLDQLVGDLDISARSRFATLKQRCLLMQGIAEDLRSSGSVGDVAGSMRVNGLNQLLWGFLRLLHHQSALEKLLESMDGDNIARKVKEVTDGLEKAKLAGDDRITRSYEERLATANARVEHFERSRKDLLFVTAELDRIEDKIQALSEMAVNQADPNALSVQIDATAESMQATESRLSEFQLGTPVMPDLDSAPAILSTPTDGGRRLA
ncbi:MAG: hypothetical protein ABIP93_08275 [Gemmatimonadaceae bacterium]